MMFGFRLLSSQCVGKVRTIVTHSLLVKSIVTSNKFVCNSPCQFSLTQSVLKRDYSSTSILRNSDHTTGDDQTTDLSEFVLPTVENVFPVNLSMMDREKEMFKTKRRFGVLYSQGKYVDALHQAQILEVQIRHTFGEINPVYASCLNNIALMNKMVGNNEKAMDLYIRALQIYEDTLNRGDEEGAMGGTNDAKNTGAGAVMGGNRIRKGKFHASYASTLTNLGLLYKNMATSGRDGNSNTDTSAEPASSSNTEHEVPSVKLKRSEIDQLLERSEEALTDALYIHTVLLNPGVDLSPSPSSSSSSGSMAVSGSSNSASSGLVDVSLQHSKESLTTAMALGSLWMNKERFKQAEKQYRDCYDVCARQYGDNDTLTATAMNNLAILLKRQAYAKAIREKVMVRSNNSDGNEGIIIPRCSAIEEAIALYENAVQIRSNALGPSHPDTITSIYNYLELLLCIGEDELAYKLQQEIVELMGGDDTDGDNSGNTSDAVFTPK